MKYLLLELVSKDRFFFFGCFFFLQAVGQAENQQEIQVKHTEDMNREKLSRKHCIYYSAANQ